MFIFTLDLVTHNCPVITAVEGLPYDCFAVIPCSAELGGVIVLSTNSIIHVAQTSRRVVLPVNEWLPRVSDIAFTPPTNGELYKDTQLEGAEAAFVDERTLILVLKDGTVHSIEIVADGRTVERLIMGAPTARTTIPAVIKRIAEDHLFVGSIVGPSVLLKTVRVEEMIPEENLDMENAPSTVVDNTDSMDLDDDDGTHSVSMLRFMLNVYDLQISTALPMLMMSPLRVLKMALLRLRRSELWSIYPCVTPCRHTDPSWI